MLAPLCPCGPAPRRAEPRVSGVFREKTGEGGVDASGKHGTSTQRRRLPRRPESERARLVPAEPVGHELARRDHGPSSALGPLGGKQLRVPAPSSHLPQDGTNTTSAPRSPRAAWAWAWGPRGPEQLWKENWHRADGGLIQGQLTRRLKGHEPPRRPPQDVSSKTVPVCMAAGQCQGDLCPSPRLPGRGEWGVC